MGWMWVAVGLVFVIGCDGGPSEVLGSDSGPFEYRLNMRDRSEDSLNVELYMDSERVDATLDSNNSTPLPRVVFDDYDQGRRSTVILETRSIDTTIHTCELRPSLCAHCEDPAYELVELCINVDGQIGLNGFFCPCGGPIVDYFCEGECALTQP